MPWLLSEDAALKTKLSGITVPNGNADERVNVRFRVPETWAKFAFPQIIIEHGSITRSSERETRGHVLLPYAPEGHAGWDEQDDPSKSPYFLEDYPIPYEIEYQITTYCRFSQQDRMLTALLQSPSRIPARFGFLVIPQDGTIRRLDLTAGPQADTERDGDGARLFKQFYTLTVSTELLPSVVTAVDRVLSTGINLDVEYYDPVISVP